ncbi:MAG: DUF2207 domain-containing protein [Clostridia bacterium]|nr:DUF2207 domain-containing protein [Clostridia bacterium]
MKGFKRRVPALILVFALTLAMILALPMAVCADDNSSVPTRVTEYFNVDVQVNENNTYEYKEVVGTVFNTEGHGIYRNIPTTFDGIQEKVNGGWCSTDPVETYEENGYYILQMGSGDSYIYGKHEFRYGYTMIFRDDRDESGDYMYIDVLPTDWQTAIGSADITIHMPKEIKEEWTTVYIGKYGVDYDDTMDSWELEDSKTIHIKAEDLEQGVGITVLTKLPEGYWVGAENGQAGKNAATTIPVILAALFGALWTRFGKRQHIVETIEFRPPEGVTPAEIGLLIDGVLDKKDMVSMFVYFAQKGYMKIEETEKKKFTFTKLKDIDDNEKEFAKQLFNGLFEEGEVVKSDDMSEDFAYSYRAACDTLEDEYGDVVPLSTKFMQKLGGAALYIFALTIPVLGVSYMLRPDGFIFIAFLTAFLAVFFMGRVKKSYKKRMSGKVTGSKGYRIAFWILTVAALLATAVGVGGAFESDLIGILYFVGFGACMFFNVYVGRISDTAAENMGKILGLREFIKTAEVDRIEALVEEDPEYFFSILPYAYVMGLTNKWIKKFENINVEAPDWYYSYNTTGHYFPIFYMGDSMGGMTSAVTTAVAPHLPASTFSGSDTGGGWLSGGGGGGFSGGGGGFSGGGGGGGGGGFW